MSRPPIPSPCSEGYWIADRWIEPGAVVDLKPGEQGGGTHHAVDKQFIGWLAY
jgi:hypothetical protein